MSKEDDIDLLKAIRILAFRAVQSKDSEYIYRNISRFYSKTFHVPLPEVDDLPVEDVLQAFFESRYEDMDDEELEAEGLRLRETVEERAAREVEEEVAADDDDAFYEQVRADAAKAQNVPLEKRKLPEDGPIVPIPALGNEPNFGLNDAPPPINMKFVSEAEMEEMGEWDLFGPSKDE